MIDRSHEKEILAGAERIVEEVRAVRRQVSAEFDEDFGKFRAYWESIKHQFPYRMISDPAELRGERKPAA